MLVGRTLPQTRGVGTRASWLLLLLLLRVPVAVAQDPSALADEEAHRLFEAGRAAFGAGRNEAALSDFEQAYELSQRPSLLYNIGQCDDRLRRDEAALHAFEQYLALSADDAPNRLEVQARVTVLQAALARHEVAAAPPEAESDEPAEEEAVAPVAAPPASDATGAWALFGTGAGLLVVGAIVLALGEVDRASIEGASDGTRWTSVSDAYGRAPVLEGIGIAALALGALGTAVGLGWALTTPGDTQALSVRLGPSSLVLAGTF